MENEAKLRIATAWNEKAKMFYGFCPDYPEMGTFGGYNFGSFKTSYEAAYQAFSLTEAFRQTPFGAGAAVRNPFSTMTVAEKTTFNQIRKPDQIALTI